MVYFHLSQCVIMIRTVAFLFCCLAGAGSYAQGGLEWIERHENHQAGLGKNARIPIRLKNTSDKPQQFIIRRAVQELQSNQKAYFCLGDDCLDPLTDQITKRLEPGESLLNLFFVVETGLLSATHSFRIEAFPKGSPQMIQDYTFSLSVEEKSSRSFVFQSRDITVHDLYPNPVTDQQAHIDYRLTDEAIKAKVVIHNILGSPVGEYELPAFESRVKIRTEDLSSGVYFYTVYLDNIGVMTRKLVVRK